MKSKTTAFLAALLAAAAAHCAPLATENFVTNKIAAATNALLSSACAYTDTATAINSRPLTETWTITAIPGDVDPSEVFVGWGDPMESYGYEAWYFGVTSGWIWTSNTDRNATSLSDSGFVAVRPSAYVLGSQTNKPLASAEVALTNSADIASLKDTTSTLSDSIATNSSSIATLSKNLQTNYYTRANVDSNFAQKEGPTLNFPTVAGGYEVYPAKITFDDSANGGGSVDLIYFAESGQSGLKQIYLPFKNGTVALTSDISATSPAFSNAVLSVGLGIDTNTVAVINELVDSAHDLPISGATSVGALLLALAAAVAALKKKFGYDTEDSAASATIALSTRTFPVVDATAKTSADTIAVTMPSSTADGKVSDMCLRIDTGASVPALTFDLSTNVFIPASGDDAWGTLEASSHNIFSFTSSGTQTVAVTDAANGNAVTNVTKRAWIVGRVTAAIVAAETINES